MLIHLAGQLFFMSLFPSFHLDNKQQQAQGEESHTVIRNAAQPAPLTDASPANKHRQKLAFYINMLSIALCCLLPLAPLGPDL